LIELSCLLERGNFRLELSARVGRRATGVFGPSGAGKSSLLHALAGLIPARQLRLVIDGSPVVDTDAGLVPPVHRRRIGMVFQDHRLFPHMSVAANLRYGLPRDGRPAPAWDDVVELLEIGDVLPRRPDQCSGGQRQRVALGRALLSGPRLLLLDEPLASLDRGIKIQILPFLRHVRDRFDVPMMMVSHDLGELLTVTDELLLVADGRSPGHGALADLAADPVALDLLHDCSLLFAMEGVVEQVHADGTTLVRLRGPGSPPVTCQLEAPVGALVELLMRPEDVIVVRGPVSGQISVRNRLPGTILGVTRGTGRCLLRIDVGATLPILAEVAPAVVGELALAPGTDVTVLFKAMAPRLPSRPG
jgi:molybdate transport system ATP-binding protein